MLSEQLGHRCIVSNASGVYLEKGGKFFKIFLGCGSVLKLMCCFPGRCNRFDISVPVLLKLEAETKLLFLLITQFYV